GHDPNQNPPAPVEDFTPNPLVYVSFSAGINQQTTETLLATMAEIANHGTAEVCLLLSTSGGNVMSGITLYNLLRAMPFKLTTPNGGNVDSIGNAVFLAGERRIACPHSTFMFHGVGYDGTGVIWDERLLRERLASILADQKRIAGAIAERTSLTEDDVAPMFL